MQLPAGTCGGIVLYGQSAGSNPSHVLTDRKDAAYMGDIGSKVDKAYEGKSIAELADAPVAALQGVSDADAAHLKSAFGITTVRDLGTNKFFLWAQAITKLAD